ncbi:MAG TPA: PKD domain-containing protein [Solirubrobacteraceae bacterium]|nr:PKD domain-containing protein [Solirubrobacteraceae bacterium]
MSRGMFAVALTVLIGATGAPPATAAVSFRGGSVMHAERVHLVFWDPSNSGLTFDPGYQEQIETFIERVAAASHSTSNVFSLIGQYGDATGPAAYEARYAGAIVDTDPLPADPGSTCTEPLPPPLGTGPGWTACVSDAGIQNELQSLIDARRLPTGLGDMYIVLTPNGFGDCFGRGPSDCALGGSASSSTPGYCGYHTDTGDPPILYAVVPYNAIAGHCQSRNPRPNGSTADPAISTVAHEFTEIATDPLGDGWSDPGGYEIADLCLTSYGPNLGGSTGATAYDQVIDGGHYYIQELWSDSSHACEASPKPDSVSISAPRRAAADALLTLTGSASDPQGKVIAYRWWFGDGRTANRRLAVYAFPKAGTYELTLRITDSWGNWAYATRPITITRTRGAARR